MVGDTEKLDYIRKTTEEQKRYFREHSIARGGSISNYDYVEYPDKGVRTLDPKYRKYSADLLLKMIKRPDVFLTIDSDGIGISTTISNQTDISLFIAKKEDYDRPHEFIEFIQRTAYYQRPMYISKEVRGNKITIVDCVISTGGTVLGMVEALQKEGVEINGVYSVVNKPQYGGMKKLKSLGVPCGSLVDLVKNKHSVICKPSRGITEVLK